MPIIEARGQQHAAAREHPAEVATSTTVCGHGMEHEATRQHTMVAPEGVARVGDLSNVEVFHGPVNLGGGAFRLARAQRALGVHATSVCYPATVYGFAADQRFAGRDELTRLSPQEFAAYAERYDIFHFYFGSSLNGLFLDDLELLKARGKKLIFYFCGCDIRDPRITREKYAISACADCWPQRCNPNRRRALELADSLADLVYVSTPDLIEFIPRAQLLQQPLDVYAIGVRAAGICRDTPRQSFVIAHSPTSRILKGTKFVIAAVESLRQRGLNVELRLIEGLPYEKALQAYITADIAVDQLLFGAYGQVSVEMMALGVPVVCFIRDEVLPLYPEAPPLIRATRDNLADVLAYYYEHPDELAAFAASGPDYAKRHHDSLVLARQTVADYIRILSATRSAS